MIKIEIVSPIYGRLKIGIYFHLFESRFKRGGWIGYEWNSTHLGVGTAIRLGSIHMVVFRLGAIHTVVIRMGVECEWNSAHSGVSPKPW